MLIFLDGFQKWVNDYMMDIFDYLIKVTFFKYLEFNKAALF